MPRTFAELLAELIKRAKSFDDPIRAEFHDGDIAHLQRWLESGEANKIWDKISNNAPFNSGDAFRFVRFVLFLRRAAKQTDQVNRKMLIAGRERSRLAVKACKSAIVKLADEKITPDQHAAFAQAVEEMLRRPATISDPLFRNRSDSKGSRRRTIFLRALSDFLHEACGKWHDAEVEELCQFAFDYSGDVDARSARRESTREAGARSKMPPLAASRRPGLSRN